ncbi:MAG TPA: LysM peptidoglycan-binding domain-containing protein [Opitutaceae bacterium]|nr:LysM peptidoglycan-binding domain-containing protein [Opitutaceae bacterium]
MKILKIFGIVVGIHLAILIGVFVVPGCSTTTRPAPSPADTVPQAPSTPAITVPNATAPASTDLGGTPIAPVPAGFNPDAPATYDTSSSAGGTGIRFTPIRPNTPAASAVLAEPVQDVTPASSYKVKSGDSLWTIAKRNHITVAELAAANGLRTSVVLRPGHALVIPGRTQSSARKAASTAAVAPVETHARVSEPAPTTHRSSDKSVTYKVKPGETIGQIAKMFGVRAKDILVANAITDPRNLRAGKELVIPGGGWQKPAGRESSSASAAESAPADTTTSTPSTAPANPPNILDNEQGAVPATTPPAPANVPVINIDQGSSSSTSTPSTNP